MFPPRLGVLKGYLNSGMTRFDFFRTLLARRRGLFQDLKNVTTKAVAGIDLNSISPISPLKRGIAHNDKEEPKKGPKN